MAAAAQCACVGSTHGTTNSLCDIGRLHPPDLQLQCACAVSAVVGTREARLDRRDFLPLPEIPDGVFGLRPCSVMARGDWRGGGQPVWKDGPTYLEAYFGARPVS